MRPLLLTLFVLASASCSHFQPKPTPPAPACLPSPPPPPELAKLADCPDGDLVLCLDKENAARLIRSIERLAQYAQEAYTRCGPPSKE